MKKKRTYSPESEPEPNVFYGSGDAVYEVKVHEPHSGSIPESLVHHIWKNLQFDIESLGTTNEERVQIVNTGEHNTDGGPDFLNATLFINEILWCGAIEIHISSKEWYHHKHHLDQRYNNTILHVTLFRDTFTGLLKRSDGSILPEIVLYPLLKAPIRALQYEKATRSIPSFPCQPSWHHVPLSIKREWVHHLATHRLSRKKQGYAQSYMRTPDFEEILYIKLFRALGYDKNSDSMAELAKRIPLSIARELNSHIKLEALYFGVAGLLPEENVRKELPREENEYVELLQTEFHRLQQFYKIPSMRLNSWLFFRLRPANFPTLRIAQAVSWLSTGHLLYQDPIGILSQSVMDSHSQKALFDALQCSPSPFWNTHFHFKKKTTNKNSNLGKSRLMKLITNVIVPFLLFYAEQHDILELEEKILALLTALPAEKDYITKKFLQQGFTLSNSFSTQGLHELYSEYCKQVQCLHCRIGKHLIGHDYVNNE